MRTLSYGGENSGSDGRSFVYGEALRGVGFYGVMVSTLDFESSDPSSNLGRTWLLGTVLRRALHRQQEEAGENVHAPPPRHDGAAKP